MLLTVCVVGMGGAAAASPTTTTFNPVWAYGAVRTVNLSGTGPLGHGYQISATFGFSVILNETRNTTANGQTVYTVHLVRTMGAMITASFCSTICASSLHIANFSYHAWERADAWANLTPNGTVTEPSPNGTVPAVALLNSSLSVTAKLQESAANVEDGLVLRAGSLVVNITGHIAVDLSPSLGLFPLAMSPGTSWNSTAAYSATGSGSWQDHYTYWGKRVAVPNNGSNSNSIVLNHTGNITVVGSYPSSSLFVFGGHSYPGINLTIEGPFALREGVILVPASADLFGGATQPWSTAQNGSADVTTARLDIHPGASYEGHLPIVASSLVWAASTTDSSVALAPGAAAASPAVSDLVERPDSSVNGTVVQGRPESVAQAEADQSCLISGTGCLASSSGVPWARYLLFGGVGAVVVALLAIGLIARRQQPAPVYPNARLYPPGQSAPGPVAPRPAPKPPEEDPLDHLW